MNPYRIKHFVCFVVFCVATVCGAQTITPSVLTIDENVTQQFKASVGSTWSTSCGSITAAGLFKAPLYPTTTCTVTATTTNKASSAKVSVTVVSPIVMTPVSAKTPQGGTQQFNANPGVTWSAKCGTIAASGLYTASGTVGSNCTIEGVATGAIKYTVYGYDTIAAASPFTLGPSSASLSEGAQQQFTASTAATFSATCGSIGSTGLYIAPLTAETCMITATPTGGGKSASATVNVSSPIAITPSSATTPQGGTQQFAANMAVKWSSSCGSISAAGSFFAAAPQGSTCIITATAMGGTAYTAMASDMVGTAPAFSLTPQNPLLTENGTQQFDASVAATYSATCGTINASTGFYTAPLAAGACTVSATATYGRGTASTNVAVSSPIVVSPLTALTTVGLSQQFYASVPVSWSSSCGTITTGGLFTAPATAGAACTITATATGGTAYTATATDASAAAIAFTLSPTQPTVVENATQQFTADAAATWASSCGSMDANRGVFTAPLTATTCMVTATATDGSGNNASTQVTVTSPITITPAAVNLHALNTQGFSASQTVTWATSCGTIDANAGTFMAPSAAGPCTVTATSTGATAYTATAMANVDIVNYTGWKGGGGNTGANTDELALTPANVNSSSFGINWSAALDGWSTAQPLYMNGISINGTPVNAVFVETANDSVYAFNADTGAQLWQVSLIPQGATSVVGSSVGFTSAPLIGILSTPVIDPATNTMYVVAETSEQSATYFPHRLHALDLTTGNEKFGGPVLVSNALMSPLHKLQRSALALGNGNVYIGFGSLQDEQPYHGLLFAFNAQTLQEVNTLVLTPTGSEGGIWMGGAAPAVDENGDVYVSVGNGSYDGSANYGESALKLGPQLQILDSFTPYNYAAYDSNNIDLGSGDIMVVPDQTGTYPHELIACGKPTPVYVLNRDNLGQLGTGADNVIQRLDNEVGAIGGSSPIVEACYTAPAMWGQNVYIGGKYDVLKMFILDPVAGVLSSAPVSQGSLVYGYPGTNPVVSANGSSSGIVWTIDTGTNTLRANDATNVASQFYKGALGMSAIRFTLPTVVNGNVYVAEENQLVDFALTANSQTKK